MRLFFQYLILQIFLLSCKNNNYPKMNIDINKAIAYNKNSPDFQEWESTKKIKLEEAYQIHLDFAKKNQKKFKIKSTNDYPLYYVYDNYYIFSTVTYIHKIGIFNCSGIWVIATTGDVEYVEIDKEENFRIDGNLWLTSYNGEKR